MALRTSFAWVSLLTFSLALSACSSATDDGPANTAPVIDSVDAPESVSEQNGTYTITFGLVFHDPDGDAVTKVRFRVPVGGLDQTRDIANASPSVSQATIAVQLSGSIPKMTYDYSLSVIDARGAESEPISKQVTLK